MSSVFKISPRPILLSLMALYPALAQADDAATLATVVVTASGYEQQIKEAPASISVISREQLESQPFVDLADAVRQIEGVSITGADPNDKDVSIRGMSGEYTLILVDGKRQNTRETMNRSTGGVQSSLIPPLAAIERVEVIRGPMSSLYGSDAMGGVINIITRKVAKQWQGTVSVSGIAQEDSTHGNTRQGDFWLSGPLKDGVVGLQIFGNYSKRAEDEIYYPKSLTEGASGATNQSVGAKLTIAPSENQEIILEAGTSELTYEGTAGKTLPVKGVNEEIAHGRDHWSVTHQGRWGFAQTSVALSQEIGSETLYENSKQKSDKEIVNTVFDALLTLPFDSHVLKTGLQYNHSNLSGIANEASIPGYKKGNVNEITGKTWAVFVEDEYAVTDKLSLTGGLRLDDSDQYGSHFSPRIYGVYKLTDLWTLRGGVASGFKAPTLRQSTPGYCMTTGRANTGLRPGTLCGNANLKPEESLSEEVGVRYDGLKGESFSLTFFNNDLKNKVVSFDTGKKDPLSPKNNIYVYDNIDEVVIRGAEVAISWPLSSQWTLSSNYTYTHSSREGGKEPAYDGSSLDGQPLAKTPEHLANLHVDFKPWERLSTYLHATYTGEEKWAAFRNGAKNTRTREATLTFDLGGRFAASKNVNLSLAVLNLTDEVVEVDQRAREQGLNGNWMVDEGRRYWAKVDASF